MVPEAMRAAWILKQDFGYETRILNMHTLKPLDTEAIVHAARDTSIVLTAEEHQIGALAWPVASAITSRRSFMASGHYRSDWRKRSLWRLGRSLGADQGV